MVTCGPSLVWLQSKRWLVLISPGVQVVSTASLTKQPLTVVSRMLLRVLTIFEGVQVWLYERSAAYLEFQNMWRCREVSAKFQ